MNSDNKYEKIHKKINKKTPVDDEPFNVAPNTEESVQHTRKEKKISDK